MENSNRKLLRDIDRAAQILLGDALRASGATQAEVATRTGISQNRVSKIMRLASPPATVGEIMALAAAAGASGTQIIMQAAQQVAEQARLAADSGEPAEGE